MYPNEKLSSLFRINNLFRRQKYMIFFSAMSQNCGNIYISVRKKYLCKNYIELLLQFYRHSQTIEKNTAIKFWIFLEIPDLFCRLFYFFGIYKNINIFHITYQDWKFFLKVVYFKTVNCISLNFRLHCISCTYFQYIKKNNWGAAIY